MEDLKVLHLMEDLMVLHLMEDLKDFLTGVQQTTKQFCIFVLLKKIKNGGKGPKKSQRRLKNYLWSGQLLTIL